MIPTLLVSVLVLSLMVPETEALPVTWFARIATAAGARLVKKSWYARCNPRDLPSGVNCPSVAYGVGLSKRQARQAACAYARTFGDSPLCGDGRHCGHCQINKFV